MISRRLAAWWFVYGLAFPIIILRFAVWFPKLGRIRLQGMHQKGAKKLHAFILQQGGLLIKIGQYIASRPDIFPLAYIDTLADLRDAVPARSMEEMLPVIEAAYEGKMADHLQFVEPKALAAASFGQVHRGRSVEGYEVAVKVQYPGLRPSVEIDIASVRLVIRLLKPFCRVGHWI